MTVIKAIILSIITFNLFVPSTFANEKNLEEKEMYVSGKVMYVNSELLNLRVSKILNGKSQFKKNDVIIDIILKNGYKLNLKNKEDLNELLRRKPEDIKVIYKRKNKIYKENMSSDELRYVDVNSKIAYIGTITAIDKDGNFVGLAHNIKISKKNNIDILKSEVYGSGYIKTKKAKCLKIGSLVTEQNEEKIGEIYKYSESGVKGRMEEDYKIDESKLFKVDRPKKGTAYIYCNSPITNEMKMHEIEIVRVGKNTSKIKVVDEDLIKYRGGIVRGMSGAPVIQDDKIIGGIRSVIPLDNTDGYIANIDYMLGS